MNKKKNLLFVLNNLTVGGAEKSLVSLLQVLDYSKYNVDLQLFKNEGMFLSQLPNEVNLLPEPENYQYFDMPFFKMLKETLKKGKWSVALQRIRYYLSTKKAGSNSEREQFGWKPLSKTLQPLKKQYDVAIGYLEKNPNYFVVDKVQAHRKIGYVMNDYEQLQMNVEFDIPYFSKLDKIIEESAQCYDTMCKLFPQYTSKMEVLSDILPAEKIRMSALEDIYDYPEGFSIISVGRLTYQKGYDISLLAIKKLIDKDYKVNWIILGDGEEKKNLLEQVEQFGLKKNIHFMGIKQNHYPYVRRADIFLHAARFEGMGLVVTEARILAKPIVLTSFNTASAHLTHMEGGIITEMNPDSLAEGLETMINNAALRKSFSDHLSSKDYSQKDVIAKFYSLIGD